MIARTRWWPVRLIGVLCLLLAWGCAAEGGRDGGEEADVQLQATATLLESSLGEEFAETFSGVSVNLANGVIVVYRLEDAELERTARELAGDVSVEFADADFSFAAMAGIVEQVEADLEYWREQGIDVNGAAPRSDGAGVVVYVASADDSALEVIQARYSPMTVFLEDRTIVVPTGEPLPPIPAPSGGLEPREQR